MRKRMAVMVCCIGIALFTFSGCGNEEVNADKETSITEEEVTNEPTSKSESVENVDSDDVTFTMDGTVGDGEYNYAITATNNVNQDFSGFYMDVTLYDENNNPVETKHFDYSKDFLAHEQIQFPFTSKNQAHDYNIKWGYDDTTETDLSEKESSFLDEICGDYLIEHVGYRYIFRINPDCVTVEEPSGSIDEYNLVYVSQDEGSDYCLVAKGDRGNYIFTQGVYGDVYCSSAGETATKNFEDENSRLTHLPDDYQKPVEPYVGMTASQVENSTWGKPNDINKTTTQYSVNEQWVYSNDKYIYIEDGVVTAIQE